MVALADAIRMAVTADGTQAVAEFKKVGAAADANLKKADSGSKNASASLTKYGVVAASAGLAIGAGLFKAAEAASEADLAQRKLQNTIHNSSALVGANVEVFNHQADALEKTTVYSHVATTTIQALLGQYKLTQAQILTATPLVEDFASKMGIDTVSAAKAVGKAFEGTGGGLQRYGIITGVTKKGTDNFNLTIAALRRTVGGFSQQEGKTFSGQVTIIKNELKHAEEEIGSGAIPAFQNMGKAVDVVGDAFSKLGIHISGQAVGELATYGAAILVVGGGITFVTGQVLKMGETFTTLKGILVGTTVATEAQTTAETEAATAAVAWKENAAGAAASNELLGTSAVTATGEIGTMTSVLGGAGLLGVLSKVALGGAAAGIVLGGMWDSKTDSRVKGAVTELDRIKKAMDDVKRSGLDLKTVSGEAVTLGSAKNPVQVFNDWARGAGLSATQTKAAARAIADLNPKLGDLTAKQSGLASATASASSSLADEAAKAKNDADHLYAVVDATNKLHGAKRDLRTAILDNQDAAIAELGAQKDYNDAVAKYGPASAQALLAQEALQRAQITAGGTLDDMRQKALDAAKAVAGGSTSSYKFRAALEAEKNQFPPLAAWIDVYLTKLAGIPPTKNTDVTINGQKVGTIINNGQGYHGVGGGNISVHAAGGPMSPGEWSWVGENGPELIKAGSAGAHVFSNTQSRAMVRSGSGTLGVGSGGGGNTYQITIQTLVADASTGTHIVDAIKAYERNHTSGWRQN